MKKNFNKNSNLIYILPVACITGKLRCSHAFQCHRFIIFIQVEQILKTLFWYETQRITTHTFSRSNIIGWFLFKRFVNTLFTFIILFELLTLCTLIKWFKWIMTLEFVIIQHINNSPSIRLRLFVIVTGNCVFEPFQSLFSLDPWTKCEILMVSEIMLIVFSAMWIKFIVFSDELSSTYVFFDVTNWNCFLAKLAKNLISSGRWTHWNKYIWCLNALTTMSNIWISLNLNDFLTYSA